MPKISEIPKRVTEKTVTLQNLPEAVIITFPTGSNPDINYPRTGDKITLPVAEADRLIRMGYAKDGE